jgi:gliding motility-associated peptidyl-prolyl isomerase
VLTFANDTIYTEEEKGIITYKVDKQELFPGLQNAIKLLKEGEQATFLFPSSMAYGYLGDKNKIGVNVPVKTNIHILKIAPNKEVNTP